MLRVLLLNPPSPERSCAPPLGLEHLAASLLEHGCDVRVIDAAAQRFSHGVEWIFGEAEAYEPDLVGICLYTNWVLEAYGLAERFRGRFRLLVAGGPHATACPAETLDHGFDVAVSGEAEETVVCLAEALEGGRGFEGIPGILFRRRDGSRAGDPRPIHVARLDALARPHLAWDLFDRHWYSESTPATAPAGVMASRGCPARCIFCANYVSGRRVRFRFPGAARQAKRSPEFGQSNGVSPGKGDRNVCRPSQG